jgi:hypothetical protein
LRKGISSGIELTGLHSFGYINKCPEQRELADLISVAGRTDNDNRMLQFTHTLNSGSSNKGTGSIANLAGEDLNGGARGGGLI